MLNRSIVIHQIYCWIGVSIEHSLNEKTRKKQNSRSDVTFDNGWLIPHWNSLIVVYLIYFFKICLFATEGNLFCILDFFFASLQFRKKYIFNFSLFRIFFFAILFAVFSRQRLSMVKLHNIAGIKDLTMRTLRIKSMVKFSRFFRLFCAWNGNFLDVDPLVGLQGELLSTFSTFKLRDAFSPIYESCDVCNSFSQNEFLPLRDCIINLVK